MRIAIIGRTEIMFDTSLVLKEAGHEIACILTAKEAPEYKRTAKDFENLACNLGVPFARGANIIEHTDFLKEAKADIAVSINYPGIIPQSVINIFEHGILNTHGGDLPRYRGNACQAWALINGEERIGLCIHKMIGGDIDSGNIIARDYLMVNHETKITEVWEWMEKQTPELISHAIYQLQRDSCYFLEEQSKNPIDALRCYPRRPEDGRINWEDEAIDVIRLINASTKPFAGAFCDFDGEKLVVWDAKLVDDSESFCAVPGQVTRIFEGGVEVACGVGKIRLLEVSLDKEAVSPAVIFTSIRQRLG